MLKTSSAPSASPMTIIAAKFANQYGPKDESGMGSIMGSIVTGFGLGIIEGLTRVFYPQLSATVVFIIMAIVLMIRPAGLFGKEK